MFRDTEHFCVGSEIVYMNLCFSGHRPHKYNFSQENNAEIFRGLIYHITNAVSYGFDTCYFGGAPGFDCLAANATIYLKKIYSIKLICVLPYKNFVFSDEFDEASRQKHFKILSKCDDVIAVDDNIEKSQDCYMKRNKYMVDNSSLLICLHDGKKGGTFETMKYAKEKGLKVINLLPR